MKASSHVAELQRRVRTVRATGAALELLGAVGLGAAAAIALRSPAAGAIAGLGLAAYLLARTSDVDAARRLSRLDPALDGAVTAFVEGRGGRLREELAAWILERRPRASHRRSFEILLAAALATAGALVWRSLPGLGVGGSVHAPSRSAPRAPASPYLRIAVDVTPPTYSRLPATMVKEPSAAIQALKGSTALVRIEASHPTLELAMEGEPAQTVEAKGGSFNRTLTLSKSMALRIGTDRLVLFEVVPDRPPQVELTAPREDRAVTTKPEPFEVVAEARDDLGLESLAILYTLAHGRGEGMTFKSGRVSSPRVSGPWSKQSSRLDPAALGLGPGDTLVMWAEATDGNAVDGPGRTASAVRLLRYDEELARLEMKSSAPAVRPLNGPLSQREILARTIRLLKENLPEAKFRERSLDLSGEQGKLREAFGLFLRVEDGNAYELDHEEKEAGEQGSDKVRKLLAEAVSAMWSAEAELATGNAKGSLPHQRLALKRLDEAFASERYALRALAPPKAPVDERRRLKGDQKTLTPRTGPNSAPETSPAEGPMRVLARRLLLASEGLVPAPSRALADELWSLPETANLSRASLAAPLYAAKSPEETSRAARAAAEALLRYLDPRPVTRPSVSREEARLFTRLDGLP